MLNNTQVIVLAGGKGKRMGGNIPKVLSLIFGKSLIEHLFDSIEKCRFFLKTITVVGFMGKMVEEKLCDRSFYALQEKQLGTGHAVLSAISQVEKTVKNILVLYGDMPNIKSDTILNLLQLHERNNNVVSMMTIKVPHFKNEYSGFAGFGRIVRDENKNLVKIVEIKDASKEEEAILEINPSLFCFDFSWLKENLPNLKNHNVQGEYYLTDLVFMAIKNGNKIASLEISPFECIGINTPEELTFAEQILNQN